MREVAITGAGPAGVTSAHLLRTRGIEDFIDSQGGPVYHRPESIYTAERFSKHLPPAGPESRAA